MKILAFSLLILPLILNTEGNNESTNITTNNVPTTTSDASTTTRDEFTTTNDNGDKSFDFLIFTQLWPTTDCIGWRERRANNTCFYDVSDRYHLWTIHGIWPTKPGTKGPFHCNNTYKFDFAKIKPLVAQLEIQWPNVHKNTELDEFWEHEWDKHGTCAMQLPQIKGEFDFFNLGLKWNMLFNIGYFLSNAKILPGEKYDFAQFVAPIKAALGGKNPSVSCVYDHKVKTHLISQVEICLHKNFTLTDCDDVYGGLNQGCPDQGKEILYPKEDSVPHTGRRTGGFSSTTWTLIIVCMVLFLIAMIGICLYLWRKRSKRVSYQQI